MMMLCRGMMSRMNFGGMPNFFKIFQSVYLGTRSKQDSIITGRRHNIVRGVEEFAMTESAYADDAAFIFPSREIAERDTPRIMKHCAEWGM